MSIISNARRQMIKSSIFNEMTPEERKTFEGLQAQGMNWQSAYANTISSREDMTPNLAALRTIRELQLDPDNHGINMNSRVSIGFN